MAQLFFASLFAAPGITYSTDFCEISQKLINGGAISKVNAPGGSMAHVWTGRLWPALSYEHKTNAVGIASACFYQRVNPQDITIVRDNMTGKRIGKYTPPSNLTLD